MDEEAADTVAKLILAPPTLRVVVPEADGSILGSTEVDETHDITSGPADAGPELCSGGSARICARPVERRHSPAAQGACPGICHPLTMGGIEPYGRDTTGRSCRLQRTDLADVRAAPVSQVGRRSRSCG